MARRYSSLCNSVLKSPQLRNGSIKLRTILDPQVPGYYDREMVVVKNQVLRFFLFSIGVIALILGAIGAFLPLLPTTPFVLLAAWCFVKSSPKAHQWIYRQPVLGDALRNWENNRAISRRAKITALTMILISAIVMWFKVPNMWLKISVYLLLTTVSIFIATRSENTNKS